MTQPSKVAAAFLFLFGVPFLGMGLFFAFAQISSRGNFRTSNTVAGALFGLVFAGVGGGLMFAAIAGYGRLKKQAALAEANPLSPWLWRKDWAARRAESSTQKSEITYWIVAIFCGLIVSPIAAKLVPQYWGTGDPRILLPIGFSLIGFILVGAAVRKTMRHRRFGDTYFEFDALPFSPGERVSGRIHLRFETSAEHGVDLRLQCVRIVVTGSGDSRSTSRVVLWQADKNVPSGALAPGPLGRAIPVDFELPVDCLLTNEDNSSDKVVWTLHARADVPGVDYSDDFEVPVFGTAAAPQSLQLAGQTTIWTRRRTSSPASLSLFALAVCAFFGWQVWRMTAFRARSSASRATAAARPKTIIPRVFSHPLTDADVERVMALPAQQQAEELLERAIGHDERALHIFSEQVAGWVGRLQMTDRMTQLERRSQFSKDLRVRYANVDLNLAVQGWHKNQDAVNQLMDRARTDWPHRAWAVYYLGMLAARDVDSDRIHQALLDYARNDQDPAVRQWAVEGMRFLARDEVLDELFISFTEDPSNAVRDRAGCNISDCGIFTRKQRMRMVPKFLDLVTDPRTTAQMRSWSFLALQEITDENLPADAIAWNSWFEEHGGEKMAAFESLEWWQVRGDE